MGFIHTYGTSTMFSLTADLVRVVIVPQSIMDNSGKFKWCLCVSSSSLMLMMALIMRQCSKSGHICYNGVVGSFVC